MNRQRRPSRGNRSPIELTTGIEPRSAASMIYRGNATIDLFDESASATLEQTAAKLAETMTNIYDAANLARRAKSVKNRKRTCREAIPNISIGDYVLYLSLIHI